MKNPHALVVDDTQTNRALLTSILRQIGFETTEASDGEEAWRLLQCRGFDVVVSDFEMPRLSGIELLSAIRQSGEQSIRRLPVVVVSSADPDSISDRVYQFRSAYFLPKPIDLTTLDALLRMVDGNRGRIGMSSP